MRVHVLLAIAMLAGCGGAGTSAPVAVAEPTPVVAPACVEQDPFGAAIPEVTDEQISVDLPAVPSLEAPALYPDGSHTVRELRVAGRKLLDQEVAVRGRVTWIYDCVTALRNEDPDLTEAKARKLKLAHPDRCRLPRFRLADAIADGEARSIKVVEVPRQPTRAEKKALPKEELADPAIWRPVPPLAVGDEVTVTGTWTLRAPRGDSDMDGLLLYGSLTNITQGWPKP